MLERETRHFFPSFVYQGWRLRGASKSSYHKTRPVLYLPTRAGERETTSNGYGDFEAPGSLQPWYTYDGKKWRVSRSSMKARMGRYSLHMSILGNTLVDTARVLPVDLSGITKLGLECWFTFSNNFIGGGSVGTYFGP